MSVLYELNHPGNHDHYMGMRPLMCLWTLFMQPPQLTLMNCRPIILEIYIIQQLAIWVFMGKRKGYPSKWSPFVGYSWRADFLSSLWRTKGDTAQFPDVGLDSGGRSAESCIFFLIHENLNSQQIRLSHQFVNELTVLTSLDFRRFWAGFTSTVAELVIDNWPEWQRKEWWIPRVATCEGTEYLFHVHWDRISKSWQLLAQPREPAMTFGARTLGKENRYLSWLMRTFWSSRDYTKESCSGAWSWPLDQVDMSDGNVIERDKGQL